MPACEHRLQSSHLRALPNFTTFPQDFRSSSRKSHLGREQDTGASNSEINSLQGLHKVPIKFVIMSLPLVTRSFYLSRYIWVRALHTPDSPDCPHVGLVNQARDLKASRLQTRGQGAAGPTGRPLTDRWRGCHLSLGATRRQPRTDLAHSGSLLGRIAGSCCGNPGRYTASSPLFGRNLSQPAGQ